MKTLAEAKKRAQELSAMQGIKWIVFRTPAGAPCNQPPANLFNTGRYSWCRETEREEYEAGGAEFID